MSLAVAQNEAEAEALIQLRKNTSDFLEDQEDHLLLRFLRARDLNVNAARIMLKKYVDWKENDADLKIIKTPGWVAPDVIVNDVKYKFTGFDKAGRPVLWVPMGRWEMRQHIQNGLRDDVFRYFYKFLNEIEATIDVQRESTGATQVVIILDVEELYFRKVAHYPSIQACLRFFKEFEAYYPEILHTVYIVNTHSIFTYIFNIVRRILSTRTIGKIKLFTSNDSVWKPVLLANIPAKAIPEEYGGDGPKVLS